MSAKEGFKVVRCEWGRRRSCSGTVHPGAVVEYHRGEWTKPKANNGPLAVFEDLDAAKAFAGECLGLEVWLCHYTPSRRDHLWYRVDLPGAQVETIRLHPRWCPVSTVLATRVKLLRRVWPKEVNP